MTFIKFDENKIAKINPKDLVMPILDIPKIGITCFSKKLVDKILNLFPHEIIGELSSANGKTPIYKFNYKGTLIAFYMSPVGAPLCVGFYEEILAMGLEKLIMFGTCGVLDKTIKDLTIIVPNKAIRDEGTSYHYQKDDDLIAVNEKFIDDFIKILKTNNYHYRVGTIWTTDAFYRETPDKILLARKLKVLGVDMECSAMAAVAKFRNKDFFQFFYAADNLDSHTWDKRSLSNNSKLDDKEKIAILALELALKIK